VATYVLSCRSNRAHPKETADFLRDRIWSYCDEVISYVRQTHPTAVFECLWPLDANQGKPSPDPAHRKLLMHVNLPDVAKDPMKDHGPERLALRSRIAAAIQAVIPRSRCAL
jgi:hypothetical protein